MARQRSCFFIGHREADASLLPHITEAIERLIIDCGVTVFYVGGYGNFDALAGNAVIKLKENYPQILLFRVIPYHPTERPVTVPKGYNGTYYPPDMERVPRRFAIPRANRAMIDGSDFMIAYVRRDMLSNSYEILEYARRREMKGQLCVNNLAETLLD